jgi:PmbA protein
MKKLLDLAMEKADQAEVYHLSETQGEITLRNGLLSEPTSSIHSGYSLRMIRDGRLGTAYTGNLLDRTELVADALASMESGIEVSYSFPGPFDMPSLVSSDPSTGRTGFRNLRDSCRKLAGYFGGRVEGQVDVSTGFEASRLSMVNSSGLDVSQELSYVFTMVSLLFPGTETGIYNVFVDRKPFDPPKEALERQVDVYGAGLPEVDVPSGKMKVMFTPFSLYAITWRLDAASSGASFFNRVSPLLEKRGDRVLSEKLTLYDDQKEGDRINPRAFDDEGVPTRRVDVFEKGVFRTPYVNLDYAQKLGMEPTASGYRGGMWGGDTISLPPEPNLLAQRFEPGDAPWEDMVRSMDRGIIVFGVLGAHSGNILNGDFSMGLNPGLYVEKGRILGRVRDGMVAGNVYDVLTRVVSVQDGPFLPMGANRNPCILLDGVSVSGRNQPAPD